MSKKKTVLTKEDILSGAEVGTDKLGRPLKHGDFVMFTSENKGRSEILFGQVICKRGAYIQIASFKEKSLNEALDRVLEGKGWFTGLAATSMTKVSKTFFEMWESKEIFDI